MKKIFLLLCTSILLFQSCSSSNSDNNSNNNNNVSVSDIDGNVYRTVTICNQTWTKSNLNVSHYRNGDPIPQVTDPTQWASSTTGAWCYYNNDSSNGAIYGKLYNWYAVNDPRGIAPAGYHIPSDAEWTNLITCLGGETVAGSKMKETGTSHWSSPNTMANNISGFTGLPGGWRTSQNSTPVFDEIGNIGIWWSSSESGLFDYAWSCSLVYINDNANMTNANDFSSGYSIRCIKN
jgi:uncharacterized protein (TIGR02145 family)